ncbi:MAG: queuosine precursor transporter [Bdellovibrionales bacterium]
MQIKSRRDIVFILLSGIFITNAILAELIGGKLIQVGPFAMSIGVIPWPVVFLTTDLINEYFGVKGVRRLTFLTMGLIVYAFLILFLTMQVPAAGFSPVDDAAYSKVFGQSLWIIVASLVAFALSQLIDVIVFWLFRHRTGGKMLWLRATGSTAISQLIDSLVIIGIAFWLPGKVKTEEFLNVAATNYSYKFMIAIALTPLIYVVHSMIDRFLGKEESERLINEAAAESLKK